MNTTILIYASSMCNTQVMRLATTLCTVFPTADFHRFYPDGKSQPAVGMFEVDIPHDGFGYNMLTPLAVLAAAIQNEDLDHHVTRYAAKLSKYGFDAFRVTLNEGYSNQIPLIEGNTWDNNTPLTYKTWVGIPGENVPLMRFFQAISRLITYPAGRSEDYVDGISVRVCIKKKTAEDDIS